VKKSQWLKEAVAHAIARCTVLEERHGKGMGKAWERHGKGMGKAWERHGKGTWGFILLILHQVTGLLVEC